MMEEEPQLQMVWRRQLQTKCHMTQGIFSFARFNASYFTVGLSCTGGKLNIEYCSIHIVKHN